MASNDELLEGLAKDGSMDYAEWPALLERIVPRLEHIVYNDFPIPSIPLPGPLPPSVKDERREASSPNPPKANALPVSSESDHGSPTMQQIIGPPSLPFRPTSDASMAGPPGALPPQLLSQLSAIQSTLRTSFSDAPPHTAQRLAELILRPTLHYRTLPSYLRAFDRVISVSSPANIFPLPVNPSPSTTVNGLVLNGSSTPDPADTLVDDFIGGAELTPIPWLNGSASPAYMANDRTTASDLRTESTSLIDGPNGAGSLETVTVTVNGIASAHRDEPHRRDSEDASITSQVTYNGGGSSIAQNASGSNPREDPLLSSSATASGSSSDEVEVARGPEVIGMEDMGPQASGSRGFDVEAALGRQGEGENMAELARRGRDAAGDGDGDVVVLDVTTDANADADTDRERESGKNLDGVGSR